ncbi:N,N-dimethylformamidase beta subunit family domain-containing protein [Ruixingdingia sedimenti]|uniref:N,N-dimethylformamidase beta subunit-like C-terminal domain-containing protein n=1 Tax=Ruixingdingia sedimenti TaxID=3073604 RepID=A0ABU1F6H6_9RHOB|nr:N,N-dimethylformamidase beta subunit family domain-containing protein [Xinfangfangia sp. LG-4]MDR5652037.1 hypothetical protein [Xinfangfangia sp. LG-4]
MDLEAYFEEWSRKPGETVRMAISTDRKTVRATLERITRGPTAADAGDGSHAFGETVPGIDITVPGRRQATAIGSYADFPLGTGVAGDHAIHLWFWSSVPQWDDAQTILSTAQGGDTRLALSVRNSGLHLHAGSESHDLGLQVAPATWYSLAVSLDGRTALVSLKQVRGLPGAPVYREKSVRLAADLPPADLLRLAAAGVSDIGSAVDGFNGKIGTPSVFGRALTGAEIRALHDGAPGAPAPRLTWNLAEHFNSDTLREVQQRAPNARIRNGAERAVTGPHWTGLCDSFLTVPAEYAAIYFHSDDMIDSNWDYDLAFDLPENLSSGIYAVRLEAEGRVDLYPLFVRDKDDGRADVLFIAPTNTYLAYANDRFASADLSGIMGHERVVSEDELYLNAHPEFGLSCYDTHADGSPVRFSSRRRPLVNVRPHYPNWLTGSFRHFAVDLFFIEWLEKLGKSYHVVTDEDVHHGGLDLLSRYKVVVTGSHPEYWTNPALTAMERYLMSGGRAMYTGGNGFYWVTSIDPDRPWIVEIRRENGGVRAWDAPPGERNHVHTGEPGGLWRYRGRGPNRLFGIGFATEGFSDGKGYRRSEASHEPRFKAFFEGVDEDLLGDFGYILNGAAGDECDRFDLGNGSPAHTVILATANGFGREYLVVPEDSGIPMPDQDGPNRPDLVRADMVYIPIAGGGEVFSVGSIAYAGALAWNGFDNNIARLTTNVLNEFIKGTGSARGA